MDEIKNVDTYQRIIIKNAKPCFSKEEEENVDLYVAALVERARKAQAIIEKYPQEKIDLLVKSIAWAAVKESNAKEIALMAVDESQLGNYEGKYTKLMKKVRGALRDIKDEKTVGIIETDKEKGIVKVAKPVGVIGALVPCTNPEATPVVKAMFAIKARNSIVLSPHPRTKKTNRMVVDLMRQVLKKQGAPEDLIIGVEEPTLPVSNALMKQCDLIVATGGSPMVKAAYSSGTPAYGVGTGNAVVVVDETADIKDAANKIMLSKTFDYATSCSSDNALVIQKGIYRRMIKALEEEGGYLLNQDEKQRLQNTLWINGNLNRKMIAQSAHIIAELAEIEVSVDTRFLMAEEEGTGKNYPFSGEKLSVVLALYQYDDFAEAIDKVNRITDYQGKGHSCGIYSWDERRIEALMLNTRVSRIMVRQPQCYANTGNWNNGMPFTMTLGCGTWGGNITTENIGLKHFMNTTWVSYPIKSIIPDDRELFGAIMDEE